jgi:hypothetical protein
MQIMWKTIYRYVFVYVCCNYIRNIWWDLFIENSCLELYVEISSIYYENVNLLFMVCLWIILMYPSSLNLKHNGYLIRPPALLYAKKNWMILIRLYTTCIDYKIDNFKRIQWFNAKHLYQFYNLCRWYIVLLISFSSFSRKVEQVVLLNIHRPITFLHSVKRIH